MDEIHLRAYRDPDEHDGKMGFNIWVNLKTDQIYLNGSKGWIKVPTEYVVLHKEEKE